MNYLDNDEPRRRLDVEMDLVALNLTHLTSRYEVLPRGRSAIVLPGHANDLVVGSGKWANLPYQEEIGGCQVMRTRLRIPGMTSTTADMAPSVEYQDPWVWQSGISLATDDMVTWILMQRLRGRSVVYESAKATLYSEEQEKPITSFIKGGMDGHCYPTESYFVQDVCTYLSKWWTVESEVDGQMPDGAEVRIDAILTNREDPDIVIGVEFKNPHGRSNVLRGIGQASSYRKASWIGHHRIPIAYCCPGKVPSGNEADFVLRKMNVGILDFTQSWSLIAPGFSWSERVGLLTGSDIS